VTDSNITKLTRALAWNGDRTLIISGAGRAWRVCSRHSSARAAHVVRAKLRERHAECEFKVINREADFDCEWGAEIAVRLRGAL
jgi:hypothetical protein